MRVTFGATSTKNNKYYKVTQLDTDLWAIEDVKSSENSISYLLSGQNKALLFDTGLGLSPVLPLIKEITTLPLITCLSHWHFDHSGGAYEFNDIIGWKSRQLDGASKHGVSNEVIQSQVGKVFWDRLGVNILQTRGFPQIQFIEQEQHIDIGNYRLNLLHTPGHTMDSICLYEANKKWLFSGDTVYPGPIYLQFGDSSFEKYKSSLDRLSKLEVDLIFPGHNAIKVSSNNLVKELINVSWRDSYKSSSYPNLSLVR